LIITNSRPIMACMLRGLVILTLVVVGTLLSAATLPAQGDRAQELLARAGSYVTRFVAAFSAVVAEEHYVQDSRTIGGSPRIRGGAKGMLLTGVTAHRELTSDFLLVQIGGLSDLRAFRDVREVDGRPVRDREERLSRLFLQPSGTAVEQAVLLERDGVRHSLGDAARTINNPLLALGFLQPVYQRRFRFSLRDLDREVGPDVWIVEFREQARPTILRQVPDGDLVAGGRFWIERQTGRVVKTELSVSDSDTITTSFAFDGRLQADVPVEMRESYFLGNEYVTGTATYRDFRRFDVRTEEQIKR
jgi:hypothetical protein